MRVLLTGFEAFGGNVENSSWETALRVVEQEFVGMQVFLRKMPVSFHRVALALREAVDETHPDLIVMLGQAASSDKVRLERIAINMMDAKSGDNDGVVPDEEPIYLNESAALFTKLPIKQICTSIATKGTPVVVSNSCGLYVCNRLYYEALRLCENAPNVKAIFVHLPLYKGQVGIPDSLGMDLHEMVGTVSAVLEFEQQRFKKGEYGSIESFV